MKPEGAPRSAEGAAGAADRADRAASRGASAWGALLHVHAEVLPILDREVQAAAGISLAWYDVLLEVNAAPDRRLTMTELGNRVVLSRTRVSRLVDEMVRAGLVERQSHATDRRSAYASATEAGRRVLRTAAPVYLRGIESHFAALATEDELGVLGAVLWRISAAQRPAQAVDREAPDPSRGVGVPDRVGPAML